MADLFNVEIEEALVGSVLKNPAQFKSVRDLVRPEDFHHVPFADAWRAVAVLADKGLEVDSVTVGDELERIGKLSEFTDKSNRHIGYLALSYIRDAGEPTNAISYASQVLEYSAGRAMMEDASTIAAHLLAGRPPTSVLQDALQRLSAIRLAHKGNQHTKTLAEAVSDAWDQTALASSGDLAVVKTGYIDLDDILDGGLYAPDLMIVAARPGQGKTALLLSIANNTAKSGKRVAVFSLEMGNDQVAMRLIAQESGVSFGKQRRGQMDLEENTRYVAAVEKLTNASDPYPIILNDLPAITIAGIRRELNRMGPVDLVIVDYLQLAGVDGKYDSRVREVTEISAGLKMLAKEFGVPFLVAAQLNRALEQRQDKRPVLADLRESGSIENDADIVAFIYRDDQYNAEAVKNGAEVIISKHRNGALGTVNLIFRPELARFESAVQRVFAPNV